MKEGGKIAKEDCTKIIKSGQKKISVATPSHKEKLPEILFRHSGERGFEGKKGCGTIYTKRKKRVSKRKMKRYGTGPSNKRKEGSWLRVD